MHVLEVIVGAVLTLLIIVDVFLTVLYARVGAGILSVRVARATWCVFSHIAKRLGSQGATVLSFCGPAILVNLLVTWAVVLALGAALIIHPALNTSVTTSTTTLGNDFITAMYAAGSSI